MKLWDKGHSVDRLIERFTIGKDAELDLLLAEWDIVGSQAHAQMLSEVGLLTPQENQQLQGELEKLLKLAQQGKFTIDPGVEDVHSQVEMMLTEKLGDVGKKLHSGRSRNDQVLVDLRLFFRHQLGEVGQKVFAFHQQLLDLANQHKEVLIPGYTHMQVAMPSSVGQWLGAYAELLVDDLTLLAAVQQVVNQNPLGSAAGYGSSLPLDRQRTTDLLGFAHPVVVSTSAQLSRGKVELQVAQALASVAYTLAKLAQDVVLFASQNYGFIVLPEAFTTGSSIMPHKKNPDVFELLRGRCNLLQAVPERISALVRNLPSGYHREFQLLKEDLFPAFEDLQTCLDLFLHAMPKLQVQDDLLSDPRYRYIMSVEKVNELVGQGVPFREAYRQVGALIASGEYEDRMPKEHTHLGSIHNLGLDLVRKKGEDAVAKLI